jgi:hypothetical protein
VWLAATGLALGCGAVESPAPAGVASPPVLPGGATGVFSAGPTTLRGAVSDFLGRRPEPVQPIEFPHDTHLKYELGCEMCHEGVSNGPEAGLPSLRNCMICHVSTARDRPRVQQMTEWFKQGRDIEWQPVYGYTTQAHVRFNHAPHVRNNIECRTCHGDLSQQTVAVRSVNLNMAFCVKCHLERRASIECVTCHF